MYFLAHFFCIYRMKKQIFYIFFLALLALMYSFHTNNTYKGVLIGAAGKKNIFIPYKNLSEYHFFQGELKNLVPTQDLIPYDISSALFSDYAHKKRFVYIPENTKAIQKNDEVSIDFPTGSILIKSFYYENTLPEHTLKNIETRLLVKTTEGWKDYVYLWNEAQTDAILLPSEHNETIVFVEWEENGEVKKVNYNVPSASACKNCHSYENITQPIGTKPQNLNKNYSYQSHIANQLQEWMKLGKLESNTREIKTTLVDYNDQTKDINLRARAYLDANCSSCHNPKGYCSEMELDFRYINQDIKKIGFNKKPNFDNPYFSGYKPYIIQTGTAEKSTLLHRLQSTTPGVAMPLLSRTLQHKEGVQLMTEWINQLPAKN